MIFSASFLDKYLISLGGRSFKILELIPNLSKELCKIKLPLKAPAVNGPPTKCKILIFFVI